MIFYVTNRTDLEGLYFCSEGCAETQAETWGDEEVDINACSDEDEKGLSGEKCDWCSEVFEAPHVLVPTRKD